MASDPQEINDFNFIWTFVSHLFPRIKTGELPHSICKTLDLWKTLFRELQNIKYFIVCMFEGKSDEYTFLLSMFWGNDIFHGPRRSREWLVLALLYLNMSSIDKWYMSVERKTQWSSVRYLLSHSV